MREIDCSPLPEELSELALETAEETLERQQHDISGINILHNAELIVVNGEDRKTLETYGALKTSMLSTVHDALKDIEKYTEEERYKYKFAMEFRKA